MAAKKGMKARAAARKQRDKWKAKRWFTIRAPRHPWNFQRIGETLGESEEHIVGRVYKMTQQEFNGDFTKMHVLLHFRVTEVLGQDALTMFIGHSHQSDHTRRQVRRYRGKIDSVVDIITKDGFLVRIKTMMITEKRIQTSVKAAIRAKAKEMIVGFGAKNFYAKLQSSLINGDLETELLNAVKPIYPMRTCVIRKSQLLQTGVVSDQGPTLDEIHAEEQRQDAELKAKKAAALAAAEEEASDDATILDAAEAMESISQKSEVVSESTEEASEETPDEASAEDESASEEAVQETPQDFSSMTVAELKELLKAAGKPVSGKKAELIERLSE